MSYKSKKKDHLYRQLGAFFYKTQWAWQGVKITLLMSKSLEIFDKIPADKIWSKKDKGVESALPHAN